MNKKVFGKKLSRNTKSRLALRRSLIRNLILAESINTTEAKAAVVHAQAEKLIRLAKSDKLPDRRRLAAFLRNERDVVAKIVLYAKTQEKNSGFVVRAKLPRRKGDNAPMASLILTKSKEIAEVTPNEKS
jgi:ribosomal protein L17